jgi:mono/diheme cytochrome c family protein
MFAGRQTWLVAGLAVCLITAGTGRTTVSARQAAGGERSGRDLYRTSCAACHGADGRGAPQAIVGFETPLPDFSDCSFASREPDADWFSIVHAGGPTRAFDRMMPAFGEALSAAEIGRILDHIRGFCDQPAWPRGELNLPRALVTEKAYPEDEAVVTTTMRSGEEGQFTNEFLYEKRIGARSQFEVAVPFAVQRSGEAPWEHGLGDVGVAFKHVLFSSLRRGSILSAAAEVLLPSGKETLGLGGGVTRVEPSLLVGQVLPRGAFLHGQAAVELSTNRDKASHEGLWRVAVGRTFEQPNFGRAWSPIVELLWARELESGASAEWDLAPQMQVTISRRQHVMINGGVRIPLNERDGRDVQVITYFLWDWFDGGLWGDGW